MSKLISTVTLAAAFTVGAATLALAQTKPTNPNNLPPGQAMQDKGSVKGSPGASGYTPGHEMKKDGSASGPGASDHAPGHAPSTSTTGTAKTR